MCKLIPSKTPKILSHFSVLVSIIKYGFEIIMPKLGVDMQKAKSSSGRNKRVMVNEGDILLEIMSDKNNMELEAEDSGVL